VIYVKSEKRLFRKAIVVLIRNTTWRCGKLERLIVKHLHKESVGLGRPGTPLTDMLQSFKLSGKKRNEFLDAYKKAGEKKYSKNLKCVTFSKVSPFKIFQLVFWRFRSISALFSVKF